MKKLIVLLTLLVSTVACASSQNSPLPTAQNVDIARYIGNWYSISSLPQIFTKSCVAQTAEYQIIGENKISVLNSCIKKNGSIKTIDGQAVVINTKTNAELVVTFNNFWTRLFRVKGDYTIVKLSEGYDTVIIGSHDRKNLWIMSRTPAIDELTYKEYVAFAKANGFDTSKLVKSIF